MHENITKFFSSFKDSFKPLLNTFKSGLQRQILEKALDRASGLETQLENPDTLLRDRGKDEGLYDLMLLDDRVKLAINLKKRLVLSIPSNIVPASEDAKDVEIAEEVENQLKIKGKSKYTHAFGYSYNNMLDNAMDGSVYGHKTGEKVFTIQEDKTVFTAIKFKHSKFFDYDYDGFGNLEKLFIGKNFGFNTVIEPIQKITDKFIIFTYPYIKDGNVYGDSELLPAYKLWRSKIGIQKNRDIHLEKWGMPVPSVVYDSVKTKPAEKAALEDLLKNFQEGTYFLIPGARNEEGKLVGKFEWSITEAKSGEFTKAYKETIDQIDKQITRVILFPDKLGFTESPGGSYNQAETQLEVLQVVIEYTHKWLEYHVNNYLIKQIVDLNFTNVENYPMLKFDRVSDKIKAEMLKILIDSGVVDKREQWIRSRIGVPMLDEKEKKEIDEAKEQDKKDFLEGRTAGAPGGFPAPKGDDSKAPGKKPNPNDQGSEDPLKKPDKMKRASNPFDFKMVKQFLNNEEESFVIQYDNIMRRNGEDVINQIERKKLIENKDLKGAASLKMPKTELKRLLTQSFAKWFFNGKVQAIDEVKDRITEENLTLFRKSRKYKITGLTTIDGTNAHSHEYQIDDSGNGQTLSTNGDENPHVHQIIGFAIMAAGETEHTHELALIDEVNLQKFKDGEFLDKVFISRFLEKAGDLGELTKGDREALVLIKERGFQITGLEEERLLKEAQVAISQGIRGGETTATVTANLRNILGKDRDKHALTIARTNMSDQYNSGRMNFFTSPRMSKMIEAYQYQAIIDDATTMFCHDHDGQVIKAGSGNVGNINPPNHFNCRSVLVPIMIEEKDDPDSFFHNYDTEMETFGSKVTAVNPEPGFGGPTK